MSRGYKKSAADISTVLQHTLQNLDLHGRLLEQKAIEKWAQVVGPQIAASSRADGVREGVIFVCCKNSMWSAELTLHKPMIIQKLNAALGKEVIKDIHFKARGFRKPEQSKQDEGLSVAVDSIELDESDINAAEEVAAACKSEELSRRIKQAIITSMKLKMAKIKDGYKPCVQCGKLHPGKHNRCDSCRTMR
ncbi:MAG: DUF721 domain-containing protein [Armatimonadota bacterium]|jgi:hypothetical protein